MLELNVKVPALELLLKYTASGIGVVAGPMLAPWKSRKEAEAQLIGAKAEADSLRLIADAQADARRALAAPDEVGHGVFDIGPDGIRQRIEFQEKKRQANIASAVRDAATDLGGKEVSNHEPDPDWTARFFDGVQDVSSEDMRTLWARVLSGEVEGPGRTSLRTLDVLKNMTLRDAQIFKDVCNFVIDNFIYYPKDYQRNHPMLCFNNIMHLENIGLVYSSTFLSKTLKFPPNNKQVFFRYQDKLLSIEAQNDSTDIVIPEILLTGPGTELYRILECTVNMDYLQSFSSFLRGVNCELSYAQIFETLPDGSVNHTIPFVPVEPMPEPPDGGTP